MIGVVFMMFFVGRGCWSFGVVDIVVDRYDYWDFGVEFVMVFEIVCFEF